MTQLLGETLAATPTGRPRSCGRACCSIMAKHELRSTCMRRGSAGLSGKSIAGFLWASVQRLSVEPEPVVGRSIADAEDVVEAPAVAHRVVQAQLGQADGAAAPAQAVGDHSA